MLHTSRPQAASCIPTRKAYCCSALFPHACVSSHRKALSHFCLLTSLCFLGLSSKVLPGAFADPRPSVSLQVCVRRSSSVLRGQLLHLSITGWDSPVSPECVAVVSHSVMSNSLRPHGLQHARLPYPSTTHGACSNSCPLSW